MFLVIVIKSEKIVPLDIVDSEAVANTITNALQNRQYDCLVYQGEGEALDNFSQAIKQKQGHIAGDREQIIKQIDTLANHYNIKLIGLKQKKIGIEHIVSNLEFDGFTKIESAKVISHVMETNTEVTIGNYLFGFNGEHLYDNSIIAEPKCSFNPKKPPGKSRYPKNINPTDANKKIWQFVVKNYNKEIKNQKSMIDKWIYACAIYRKVCHVRKINAWNVSSLSSGATDELRVKVSEDDAKADAYHESLFLALQTEALVKKLGDEKYGDVEKHQGKFHCSTVRRYTLAKNVDALEVLQYLKKIHGFTRNGKVATQQLSPVTTIVFKEEKNKLNAYNVFGLAPLKAKILVGNSKIDDKELTKRLKKLMRVWLETGNLKFRKKDTKSFNN